MNDNDGIAGITHFIQLSVGLAERMQDQFSLLSKV
jgi:hypothetical protein